MFVHDIHQAPDGALWFASCSADTSSGSGVSRYDGKEFVVFTTEDGLVSNDVFTIHSAPDGVMWFGTFRDGVSRYDGKEFVNFTTKDGLASNTIKAIHRDPDGALWVGTAGGVARYEGDSIGYRAPITFAPEDGTAPGSASAIHRAPDGMLWFGTGNPFGTQRGVFRYDSSGDDSSFSLVNFTTFDGLAHNNVRTIHSTPDGVMWFGTDRGGVSRYDGKELVNFTTEDGLASNSVLAIHCHTDGVVWFATWNGVSRYDGRDFVNFTTEDGLASNFVVAIHCHTDGVMWFGTMGGGASRYELPLRPSASLREKPLRPGFDTLPSVTTQPGAASLRDGKEFPPLGKGGKGGFVNFTTEDGLASNSVVAIHCHTDGVMWFGTWGGGVSGYDGVAWTSLDTRDGLADNRVLSIESDADGTLWFVTLDGLTRYRRSKNPPKVHIVSVTTDQTYRDLDAIPAFTPGTRVTIEYNAIDFKTLPEKRQYRTRIYESVNHATRNT